MTSGAMSVWSARSPTLGEIALADQIFDARIDMSRLRLFQLGGPVRAAFVLNGAIMVFHGGYRAPLDFANAAIEAQGLFVHELTHVMQAQAGVVLPLAKLTALGRAAYRYRLIKGQPFGDYGLEQQAEIVRHAFLLSRGFTDCTVPPCASLAAYRAMGAPGAG